MTLTRARVLKRPAGDEDSTRRAPLAEGSTPRSVPRGRRIARPVFDAQAEAARIVAGARAEAERIRAAVHEDAAREAREAEEARLAAAFLELRKAEDERQARDLDRAIELATLLAERLVGEGLSFEPARIAGLAAAALAEARGARRVRIDASPEDVPALREVLAAVGHEAEVGADPGLGRGSLVVHTDLGSIDARLRPQLDRLAAALREAMR